MKFSDELEIKSEVVEPTAAYIVARLFMQAQEIKKNMEYEFEYVAALRTLWQGVRALNRLAIACKTDRRYGLSGGTHFSIAMSNEMFRIGKFIEEEIKIDPWKEWREY